MAEVKESPKFKSFQVCLVEALKELEGKKFTPGKDDKIIVFTKDYPKGNYNKGDEIKVSLITAVAYKKMGVAKEK